MIYFIRGSHVNFSEHSVGGSVFVATLKFASGEETLEEPKWLPSGKMSDNHLCHCRSVPKADAGAFTTQLDTQHDTAFHHRR